MNCSSDAHCDNDEGVHLQGRVLKGGYGMVFLHYLLFWPLKELVMVEGEFYVLYCVGQFLVSGGW